MLIFYMVYKVGLPTCKLFFSFYINLDSRFEIYG
jgi:hypothetical protein